MVCKFSELFEWSSGKPVDVSDIGQVPVYGSNGVIGYCDTEKYKDKIILGRVGAYCGSVEYCSNGFNATDNTLITTCDTSKILYRFAYYLLKQYKLNGFAGGSAQPLLTQSLLKNLKCNIPDVDIQKGIVGVLEKYDSFIELNTKRIKTLEQMAENLYKEWFVRFRFPGHENAEFENGIPKEWEYKKLNDLIDVRYGKDHKSIEDGDIPVFGSGGIMRYGDKQLYSGETVLIPRKGTLNNIMYYNGPFWTVDTMFYSVPLIENFAKYAYYTLSKFDMESFNSGAALPSMTTNILYHFKMLVPDADLLKKFDSFVSTLFLQKEALQKENENLIKQRDLLLPRLMSGKLEV